ANVPFLDGPPTRIRRRRTRLISAVSRSDPSAKLYSRPKNKEKRLLNRRDFNGLCVALGTLGLALDPVGNAAAAGAERSVKLRGGTIVPALGQGSWHLGQSRHPAGEEEEALRTGISLGMTLIDTAENYGEGRSEELIGRAIAGQRDR